MFVSFTKIAQFTSCHVHVALLRSARTARKQHSISACDCNALKT